MGVQDGGDPANEIDETTTSWSGTCLIPNGAGLITIPQYPIDFEAPYAVASQVQFHRVIDTGIWGLGASIALSFQCFANYFIWPETDPPPTMDIQVVDAYLRIKVVGIHQYDTAYPVNDT